ncbi:MAG TPA: TatD family hydrolase [Methylophilus sp.]|nr:TatD family hydrolase [Methylophilus sp.]HQQ33313.1 TatD family hydrolase [Methylophilus sp.]
MLIDTHCHLDAAEFDADREVVLQHAQAAGLTAIVVPAVEYANFQTVVNLAKSRPCIGFALGIHPMYVEGANPSHLKKLSESLENELTCIAIGEIGLDYYVTRSNKETQEYFFTEQLKLAQRFDLPVILHVRNAIDDILKFLRKIPVRGGIAHAFNGSRQQADIFIDMGFKLGFGGAMTYPRALKIRELAVSLPIEAIVLETDAPDIPPAWIGNKGRNSPAELKQIAQVLADLRNENFQQVIDSTSKNALQALPKLADLCTSLKVIH